MEKIALVIMIFISGVMLFSDGKTYGEEPNEEKPEKNITMFYEMKTEDIEKLKKGIEVLSIGDNEKKIIEILREPTYKITARGKRFNAPITGYILEYYIKKIDATSVTIKYDRYVMLILDKSHNLKEIKSNLEGIESRK
jgi:hypothetical protein